MGTTSAVEDFEIGGQHEVLFGHLCVGEAVLFLFLAWGFIWSQFLRPESESACVEQAFLSSDCDLVEIHISLNFLSPGGYVRMSILVPLDRNLLICVRSSCKFPYKSTNQKSAAFTFPFCP